jgi:hypothetical protein
MDEVKKDTTDDKTISAESTDEGTVKVKFHLNPDKKKRRKKSTKKSVSNGAGQQLAYPKHPILKVLRIPQAILEQNAGKECKDQEAAAFANTGLHGPVRMEISSAIKYGLLHRPAPGSVKPTELVRRITRPQKPNDRIDALRQAVLNAPIVSDLYKHYRGENLPDHQFLLNTATDSFHVPKDKAESFANVFLETLHEAELLEDVGGKQRVLDITNTVEAEISDEHLRKLGKGVTVNATDTCFVVMPFAVPHGAYYASIYEPAISKAGLRAVRADAEIFGTGKIIDQIWSGINSARVLVAELTTKNANVFYELGMAHALHKPVVLVSSNEQDVPHDIRHVRVIYYDMTDPFWGDKLIDKIAENIVSALKNPNEAILFAK